jgi:predicted nucleic acid-binding protein
MAVVLLDTDVVSFILKADTRTDLYMPYLEGQTLALCFMTVAELFQWAAVRQWGPSRTGQLEMTLQKYVVLPFDFSLCRRWGEIRAGCRAAGQPISPQDAWIAASALYYKLPLVTHNPADFTGVKDLQLITAA